MNRKYFELMQAREDCLRNGDDKTAEALFNAAIELAKLGVAMEGKTTQAK
jgi:hypothetical protein